MGVLLCLPGLIKTSTCHSRTTRVFLIHNNYPITYLFSYPLIYFQIEIDLIIPISIS